MKLSPRDLEICKYITEGKNNNEIAHIMYLSVHTIKFRISEILNSLGAKNRTHAAYILGKENIINM